MSEAQTAPTVSKDPFARLIERQGWISPEVETGLQSGVAAAFNVLGGEPVRRALHGDWLNEPLHAVLTDIPVGAWTVAVAADAIAALTDAPGLDRAADTAVAVGLVGAAGAAVTGMNDWAEVREPAARRIGLVHAALNIAATGLFVGSCIARARRARSTGRSLAALGYVLVAASAHLGGNLVYEHGIGVAPRPGESEVTDNLRV